eukprot:COSAG02_NODE_28237_length_593_cov_1.022267_1_plen_39_part_01
MLLRSAGRAPRRGRAGVARAVDFRGRPAAYGHTHASSYQ